MSKWNNIYPEAAVRDNGDGSVHITFPEGFTHPFSTSAVSFRLPTGTASPGGACGTHTHTLSHELLDREIIETEQRLRDLMDRRAKLYK
jgi:hypothetical protein